VIGNTCIAKQVTKARTKLGAKSRQHNTVAASIHRTMQNTYMTNSSDWKPAQSIVAYGRMKHLASLL